MPPEPAGLRAGAAPHLVLAYPSLPPAPDAIGEHTALLAAALAERCAVTVLAAEGTAPVSADVPVRAVLRREGERVDAGALAEAVAAERPDGLLLQYNPNSWGRRGLNLALPGAVRAAKRAWPRLRLGLMVHEPWYLPTSAKRIVLATAQRPQLRALVRAADVVFVSTEAYGPPLQRWAGATPFVHLPVGSNIPEAGWTREGARAALGIAAGALVAGVFGTAHHSRLLPLVRAAAERMGAEHAAREAGGEFLVLYVGPDGAEVRAALAGLPVCDLGRLPAGEVSRALAAMDLHLTPFELGVSTRRGSFVAGLQHGVPSVSTRGPHTGRLLAEADGTAFVLGPEDDADAYAALAAALAADPARRASVAEAARRLYRSVFDWPLLAERVLDHLPRRDAARVPAPTPAALR
jgi:glycosyltransferase involved in cell wall biosynthesis